MNFEWFVGGASVSVVCSNAHLKDSLVQDENA